MRLPLELLLHVFNILAEQDYETLKECALVCSQFSSHCQRLLFEEIELGLGFNMSVVQRLWKVLEGNPELGTFVKSLYLYFLTGPSHADPDLPRILTKFTQVKSFTLRTAAISPIWRTIFPSITRAALDSILHSPALNRLAIIHFSEVPFSATFSQCCQSLTSLELDLIESVPRIGEGKDIAKAETRGGRGPLILRYLTVDPPALLPALMEARWDDNLPVFDFSQLRHLTIETVSQQSYGPDINGFLRRGVPLEKLDLIYHGVFKFTFLTSFLVILLIPDTSTGTIQQSFEGLFTYDSPLVCFSTLRYITVSTASHSNMGRQYSFPFGDLLVELRRFPARSVLEDVRLQLKLFVGGSPCQAVTANDDWISALARSFERETFPFLKSVGVDVTIRGPGPYTQLFGDVSFDHLDLHFDLSFTSTLRGLN